MKMHEHVPARFHPEVVALCSYATVHMITMTKIDQDMVHDDDVGPGPVLNRITQHPIEILDGDVSALGHGRCPGG